MQASGGTINNKYGFAGCFNMTTCDSTNAEANAVAYWGCKSMQQNKASAATPYYLSYADSGTSNACADTAAGGYNS
jgi:hypothetical protein